MDCNIVGIEHSKKRCVLYLYLSKDISVSRTPVNSQFFIWKLCKGIFLVKFTRQ
ncbi:hypothetical protein HHI36_009425, partial [Cryptolaemus montrouzieri]